MKPLSALAAGLVGAALLAAPAVVLAQAQDDTTRLADEIIGCAGLENDAERLACFDALAEPLMGLEQAGDGAGPAALHSFTGKDDWDSETLEFEGPWRLVWQNQGSLLTVELRTPQGELVDVVGNQIGRGGGRSEALDPGSYRLAVRGLGGWRVQAVDEPD
ncbi:MAG: hypothetical protein Kow00114_08000 [Kiloniellaceae bacterium]